MATAAATGYAPGQAALPVAPEAVQKWLRQEDWEALTKAWQEAEMQAIAWAEGPDNEEVRMEELWHEASGATYQASNVMSTSSLPPLSKTSTLSTKGPRRKKWDEDFHLVGLDSRRPPPLRRYFDRVPGESTLPKGLRGEGSKKGGPGKSFDPPPHLQARKTWVETHHQTVSPDNEALHPHLRTYFDRRGLEACYRQRPHIDRDTKKLRPRTPQRPSTREKIMRFKSLSEPSLQGSSVMSGQSSDGEEEEMGVEGRHKGGTNWGRRCLEHNSCQIKVKPKKVDGIVQKIPWVKDHHVTVATDNEGLNPMLRHFFDQDGLESSFRNRGMHYGRKPLDTWGVEELLKKKMKERQRANSNSSWDSVPSSLLEKLSYTSLVDGSTPGGLPVVGGNAYSGGGSAGVSGTGSGRNIGEGYAGQGENL